jgi:asparagine synthase (glutamine-hydrolysing)
VIFSNTLESLRRHPCVSDRLNDLAVADFLLFDFNQDKSTTTFADIQRIPPGHSATWSQNGMQLRQFWTLPIDEPIFYRRRQDYIDRFQDLLRTAVGDRLRAPRVGIFMSGGLDSTTLAAAACDLLPERNRVRAFTLGDSRAEERQYAGLTATRLGIPIEFEDNTLGIDEDWFRKTLRTPEPIPCPTNLAADCAFYGRMASHSRVAFYGEGADNALHFEGWPYFGYLHRHRFYGRLVYDLVSHVVLHRHLPLRSMLRIAMRRPPRQRDTGLFPEWVNPDLERRFQLRTRWDENIAGQPSPHPIRPVGYHYFTLPAWQEMFSTYEAGRTRSALEVRYPFLDLRLLRFMLALPASPWCRSKYLLRRAMRDSLPAQVLNRPKAPLLHDPWAKRIVDAGMPPLDPDSLLDHYVDVSRVRRDPVDEGGAFWTDFRIRALNYWLRNRNPR